VEPALDASLADLQTSYVDLYLMHWPSPFSRSSELFPKDSNGKNKAGDTDYIDTYKALEKCLKSGKAKAIGISNFSKAELERLLKETTVPPAAHQMELHPWLQQSEFADLHKQKGIHITQYSPFGNQNEIYDAGKGMGKLMDDPVLVEIGKKHGKSGAQVALAWGIAKGHSVIPKSKTESRIKQVREIWRREGGLLCVLMYRRILRATSNSTRRMSRRSIALTRSCASTTQAQASGGIFSPTSMGSGRNDEHQVTGYMYE
jgi:alcohol dehydrogenase (NADP+)